MVEICSEEISAGAHHDITIVIDQTNGEQSGEKGTF